MGCRVGEPVDQAEHRGRDECDAGQVQPGPDAAALLLQEQDRSGPGEAGEDQVHVEAPAPGQVLGQDPAEHQADRAAGADDGAIDAERLAAVPRVRECRGQDRQGGRREQRTERALGGACRHQHAEGGGRPAGGRRGGEAERAGEERDLAPDQVAQPPAEQQQAAERQRVGGHHPLPVPVVKPRARCADGSAIFTTVASSTTMSWARATVPRISHRRGSGVASGAAENVVVMQPMLSACRLAVVVRGKRFLPGQRGCGGAGAYSAGSSRKWVPRANTVPGRSAYARRMRTDRDRRPFYAAGWVISAGVMAVTFRMWQLHVRDAEQRAEEAERTGTRPPSARRWKSGCGSPVSCTIP